MKRTREQVESDLNLLAPRLLDIAAAHDRDTAHTPGFESQEEQTLLHLRFYALGLIGAMPPEWAAHVTRINEEMTDSRLLLFDMLRAHYAPAAGGGKNPTQKKKKIKKAPSVDPGTGKDGPLWTLPKPTLKHVHTELAPGRFPWVDHDVMCRRRHFTRKQRRNYAMDESADDNDGEGDETPSIVVPSATPKPSPPYRTAHQLDDIRRKSTSLDHCYSNGNGIATLIPPSSPSPSPPSPSPPLPLPSPARLPDS